MQVVAVGRSLERLYSQGSLRKKVTGDRILVRSVSWKRSVAEVLLKNKVINYIDKFRKNECSSF